MIRLHHERSRRHFEANARTIKAGAGQLAETFAIELAETVAQTVPTPLGDNLIRRKVADAMRPRIADLLAGIDALDDGPQLTAKPQAMPTQTLTTIGLFAVPALWLLSRLPWSKWLKQRAAPAPIPAEDISEAGLLPGDYAALQRLKDRAERYGNPTMYDALTIVEEQFMIQGEGWEAGE